ncbi:unnamed protein product [Sphenostylis stenocarpa]|uniref:9-cis-epoxycarotenoid dioxygenase n=1 Tax=Sphenostylis stenocarpa TaxID=92480 RepID=A0AA86W6H5_9FABA|nr:unnamed protein product [Sphenostylis stenocarpa]
MMMMMMMMMALNSTSWVKSQPPHSFSSCSYFSSLTDVGFPARSKEKPIRKVVNCAPHSPPVIHFPKPLNKPKITKEATTSTVTTDSSKRPEWNPFQKTAAVVFDMFETALLSRELQQPLPKTTDPHVQIAGNFAPVPEHPVQHSLPIIGTIPKDVNGVYLRNGANPLFQPKSGHHFFDGDGMVHAVKINDGTASYACRFTETQRLMQERQLGKPVFPKAIGQLHGYTGIARLLLFYARGLCGIVDHRCGAGAANAGLVFFNGKLLAMSEDDLPYELRITASGDLQTIGRYSFNDQLDSSMIAHPKIDPISGELFSLSYDITSPCLKYFNFSPEEVKSPDVQILLDIPTMTHDFAITENFVVIPDQQVVFNLGKMFKGGSPVMYDCKKKSRFGVLPKYASDPSSIVWVESPNTFCFHLCNAWEEGDTDEVVIIGPCMTPPDSVFNDCEESLKTILTEIRLNLRTGASTRRDLVPNMNLEVGMVNRNRLGRKTQFVYLGIAEPWPKVSGLAKVDLVSGEVRKHQYGDRRYGGEPFFLPTRGGSEDEGFIMALVHDEVTWQSELQILNGVDLKLEATVMLPNRVPYGFHGTFVEAKDLAVQSMD